ncbi:MAG TPA: protein kinase [Bacteroidota bacterium]|nr:protein kinase [Bacteroidota bacterium]
MVGQTISHYRVLEELGHGGMGVVYKAQDTKLNRFVALKFLPPHLSASEADKARFMQEAQAAAALNHPNICTIYGIDEHEGQMFIAMEFVDGQTLSEKKGSISFKQAIDIGIQIADGLAAAHDKGIVHRDIKPENIMIRKDGIAQVMDFGLAKLRESNSKITRLTKAGSTVGTAGYMSPEQVQGFDADHRSDIFSYGVLLFELITGELPFKGVHETALAYEIVNVDPPPMSSIKPDIDPSLDAVVLECLEKDSNERTQSIKQVSIDLKRYRRESSRQRVSRITAARPAYKSAVTPAAEQPEPVAKPKKTPLFILAGLSVVFLALAVVLGIMLFNQKPSESISIRSYILAPDKMNFAAASGTAGEGHIALSPDGTMLAFVSADSTGRTRLMLRQLDDLTAKELPETEGAFYPFWSPDNRFIGFFETGKLKKIEAAGGPPVTVCDAADARGGSWGSDGTIIFAPTAADPLFRVPAAGGQSVQLTSLDSSHQERSNRWPFFLPDGNHFLYFGRASFGGVEREEDELVVGSLDGKTHKRIIAAKGNVEFANGHLLYLRENTLMAQPFDDKKLEVTGDPAPVAEPIEYDLNYNRGVFSSSKTGLLVYQASNTQNGWQLEWMNRGGQVAGLIGEPAQFGGAYISPDNKQIAYDVYDPQSRNRDIWIYDLARNIKSRFTFDPAVDELPIWSPDGSRIIFHSDRKGHYDLYEKTTSGAGGEELLLESPEAKFPLDWSSDRKYFLYSITTPQTKSDLWILPLTGDKKPVPFLESPFDEDMAQFSPDMRWIAYRSNESGQWELYVRPFLGPDGSIARDQARKWQISTNGISTISANRWWSRDGLSLYYLSADNKMMMVDVKSTATNLEVGTVRPLFEVKTAGAAALTDFTSDAQKFLLGLSVGNQGSLPLTLISGWDKELRKK